MRGDLQSYATINMFPIDTLEVLEGASSHPPPCMRSDLIMLRISVQSAAAFPQLSGAARQLVDGRKAVPPSFGTYARADLLHGYRQTWLWCWHVRTL